MQTGDFIQLLTNIIFSTYSSKLIMFITFLLLNNGMRLVFYMHDFFQLIKMLEHVYAPVLTSVPV